MHLPLLPPLLHRHRRLVDELAQRVGLVQDAVPEGVDTGIEVVDVDVVGVVLEQQRQRDTGTAGIRFDVIDAEQIVLEHEQLDVVGDLPFAARVAQR